VGADEAGATGNHGARLLVVAALTRGQFLDT
jgi:hypothetical protein